MRRCPGDATRYKGISHLMHKDLLLLLEDAGLRVDGREEPPSLRHVEPLHTPDLEA